MILIEITRKSKFLVLGKGPTDRMNDNTFAAENKLVLNLVTQIQTFF